MALIEEKKSLIGNEHVDSQCSAALMSLALADAMAMRHFRRTRLTYKDCQIPYSVLPNLNWLALVSYVRPS